jgi:hypothetical protein
MGCDIENPKNDNVFKVNGHGLKVYFDNFSVEMTLLNWVILYIKIDSFSHIVFLFLFGVTFFLLASLTPSNDG